MMQLSYTYIYTTTILIIYIYKNQLCNEVSVIFFKQQVWKLPLVSLSSAEMGKAIAVSFFCPLLYILCYTCTASLQKYLSFNYKIDPTSNLLANVQHLCKTLLSQLRKWMPLVNTTQSYIFTFCVNYICVLSFKLLF